MIGNLYPKAIDDDLNARIRNPGPTPEQSFSLWSFTTAGLSGIPAAAMEVGASIRDFSAGIDERRAEDEARRAQVFGRAPKQTFQMPTGEGMRAKSDQLFAPAETAHTADQVVYGLTRFVGKAAGAMVTAGPVAGGAMLGLEEGNTIAQRLMEGDSAVDPATAAKVGAVGGALSAFGAMLPAGGGTLAKTAAIAITGGPATFVAQEGLSRKILQEAGYKAEAAKHDPTDPLGLILSTIPGAVVGGIHMAKVSRRAKAVEQGMPIQQMTLDERKALKYNDVRLDAYAETAAEANGVPPAVLLAIKNAGEKSNPTAVSPKGAQGVMQFMPATAKEMGIADPTDPIQSIDGAAKYLKKLFDQYGSWDAAVAHYNGGGKMAREVLEGKTPSYPETAKYLERVRAFIGEETAVKGSDDPEVVAAARVQVEEQRLAETLPDVPNARAEVMRAMDELGEGRMPNVRPVPDYELPTFKAWFGESKVVTPDGQPLVVYHGTNADFESFDTGKLQAEGIHLSTEPAVANRYSASRAMDGGKGANVIPVYVRAERVLDVPMITTDAVREAAANGFDAVRRGDHIVVMKPEQIKSAIGNSGKFDPNSGSLTDPLQPGEVSPRESPLAALETQSAGRLAGALDTARSDPEAQGATRPDARPTEQPRDVIGAQVQRQTATRVAQLAADRPDLAVRLPGSDETMLLSEALEAARAQAKEDAGFADLVKAAANCALSFG